MKCAEKSYKQAESDAESMQKVLKDATKKGVTGPVISEIVKNSEKLQEKVKRENCRLLLLYLQANGTKLIQSFYFLALKTEKIKTPVTEGSAVVHQFSCLHRQD